MISDTCFDFDTQKAPKSYQKLPRAPREPPEVSRKLPGSSQKFPKASKRYQKLPDPQELPEAPTSSHKDIKIHQRYELLGVGGGGGVLDWG